MASMASTPHAARELWHGGAHPVQYWDDHWKLCQVLAPLPTEHVVDTVDGEPVPSKHTPLAVLVPWIVENFVDLKLHILIAALQLAWDGGLVVALVGVWRLVVRPVEERASTYGGKALPPAIATVKNKVRMVWHTQVADALQIEAMPERLLQRCTCKLSQVDMWQRRLGEVDCRPIRHVDAFPLRVRRMSSVVIELRRVVVEYSSADPVKLLIRAAWVALHRVVDQLRHPGAR